MAPTNGSAKSTRGRQEKTGDSPLDFLIECAEYELEQDPYRGMLSINPQSSPWYRCQCVQEKDDKVSRVTGCACPSLRAWTEEADALRKKERRRKRKKSKIPLGPETLGRRRDDPDFTCSCDYNPLCLVSLGGALDDFLANVAKDTLAGQEEDEVNSTGGADDVIDVDKDVISIDQDDEPDEKKQRGKEKAAIEVNEAPRQSGTAVRDAVPSDGSTNSGNSSPAGVAVDPRNKLNMDNLEGAYKRDISFSDAELDPDNKKAIYGPETRLQFKSLRRMTGLDLGSVLAHASFVVSHDVSKSMTEREYLSKLRSWHEGLVFANPLREVAKINDKLQIAVPPGMKNLGATCYLNTQLQCLARNTVFLDGIFSWRPSSDQNNPMNSVLSKLQLLLARMIYGDQRTITTEEFSLALGLETNEMQDPNEFARLLFTRMHESFVMCGEGEKASKEQASLSKLLPSLFEGTTTYETTCSACGNCRKRDESFMDLNLTISHRRSAASPMKDGQLKLTDAFAAGGDTDVQYCLDQYTNPEELVGDNQYWCETCQSKKDATRRVVLSKLPPVLNLQLCRYVFDRATFAKKKLSEKVLLSRELLVSEGGDEDNTHRYILCAVMRHQGTSAYTGHYLAEALDWQTGAWFEFNDDIVKVLPDGPSNSSEAQLEFSANGKKKKVAGSSDAYNMYYVRESFLAKSAVAGLRGTSDPSVFLRNQVVETDGVSNVLSAVAMERATRYSLMNDLCLNDGKIADRLKRRNMGLGAIFSSCFSEHQLGGVEVKVLDPPAQNHPVWVDGETLRQIISGSEMSGGAKTLCFDSFKCEHGRGLSPAVARQGKLVPRPMFDGIIRLLNAEQAFRNNEMDNTTAEAPLPLEPGEISCESCATLYKKELAEKLGIIRLIADLCDDLDPKSEKSGNVTDDSDEQFIYALSRKFVTRLRSSFASVTKKLGAAYSAKEGLTSLDLSMFEGPSDAADGVDSGQIDRHVNSNIMCPYRRCCSTSHKRMVRYVSEQTWSRIRILFPEAVELKKEAALRDEVVPCEQCLSSNNEKEALLTWTSDLLESGLSVTFVNGKRRRDIIPISKTTSQDGSEWAEEVVLVHKLDMKRWRDAVSAANSQTKEDSSWLKNKLFGLLFGSETKEPEVPIKTASDPEAATPLERLLREWNPQPLICKSHGQSIRWQALQKADDDEVHSEAWRIGGSVEALTMTEHLKFVESIYGLHSILVEDEKRSENDKQNSSHAVNDFQELLFDDYHPTITLCDAPIGTKITLRSGKKTYQARLSPSVCPHNCGESLQQKADAASGNEVVKSVGLVEDKVSVLEVDGIELIEPDHAQGTKDAGELSILVCEIIGEDNVEKAISAVAFPSGPTPPESEKGKIQFPRRSSRKRKRRFPGGVISREDTVKVGAEHNLAALRLFMCEKCLGFRCDQALTLVFPSLSAAEDARAPLSVHIPYEWNTKTLSEAIAIATDGLELSEFEKLKALSELVLIRQAHEQGTKHLLPNETLMESLLTVANISTIVDGCSSEKKTKKRRTERGFQGTLLHGGTRSESRNEDEKKETDASDGDKVVPTSNPVSDSQSSPQELVVTVSSDNEESPIASPLARVQSAPKKAARVEEETRESGKEVISVVESNEDMCTAREKKVMGIVSGFFGNQGTYDADLLKGVVQDVIENSSQEASVHAVSDIAIARYLGMRDEPSVDVMDGLPKNDGSGSSAEKTTDDVASQVQANVVKFLKGSAVSDTAFDADAVYEAVRWAIETNSPHVDVASLSDIAYAKYIERMN